MPPTIRYTRDAVMNAAFTLTRARGLSALNARAVAQELGSSTQPIFRLFAGMDELRAGVIEMVNERLKEYMAHSVVRPDAPYLGLGMSYVLFARDEPELFKALFMRDRVSEGTSQELLIPDGLLDEIHAISGFTPEQAAKLHGWLWIFAHGLAVGIATKYFSMEEERIEWVLTGAFEAAAAKLRQDIAAGLA